MGKLTEAQSELELVTCPESLNRGESNIVDWLVQPLPGIWALPTGVLIGVSELWGLGSLTCMPRDKMRGFCRQPGLVIFWYSLFSFFLTCNLAMVPTPGSRQFLMPILFGVCTFISQPGLPYLDKDSSASSLSGWWPQWVKEKRCEPRMGKIV